MRGLPVSQPARRGLSQYSDVSKRSKAILRGSPPGVVSKVDQREFANSLRMGQRVEIPMSVCHSRSFERLMVVGISLAERTSMKFFCRHCDEIVVGQPYRVISDENGVILLDMTVCRSCDKQARALGLHSEAIPRAVKSRAPRRRWVHAPAATAGG